jgi:hypothetical protein
MHNLLVRLALGSAAYAGEEPTLEEAAVTQARGRPPLWPKEAAGRAWQLWLPEPSRTLWKEPRNVEPG